MTLVVTRKQLHDRAPSRQPAESVVVVKHPTSPQKREAASPAKPPPQFLTLRPVGASIVEALPLRPSADTVWVGRWRERAGVWLDDGGKASKASRLHARLDCAAGGWRLTDNGSANGTFVNGARIDGPTPLAAGDRVGFGSSPDELHPDGVPLFHFVCELRTDAEVARRPPPTAHDLGALAAPALAPTRPAPRRPRTAAPAPLEAAEPTEKASLLALVAYLRDHVKAARDERDAERAASSALRRTLCAELSIAEAAAAAPPPPPEPEPAPSGGASSCAARSAAARRGRRPTCSRCCARWWSAAPPTRR